jgi:RNA polymerase sigma-70 factor (ECF subfamily)
VEDEALSIEEPVLSSESMTVAAEDPAATFARLLDRSLDRQYRLATAILGDPIEAEDAVHDAALVAWRGFGKLRDIDRFDAWFGRILVNGCRDRLRARRRRPIVGALPMLGNLDAGRGRSGTTRDPVAAVGDRDELERAIATLDPDHVGVIALRFASDLSIAEIAVRLGIPEGTVKSRLHHALRRLRTALERASEERS